MKVSYNWLREFVEFNHTPDELAELLTWLGLEVDSVTEVGANWTDIVVGKVITCSPVPKTDHLSHCTVDVGENENLSIVCGAPNVGRDQIVPVARVGAVLPDDFKITKRKLRGVESYGMICSEKELGLSDEAAGIMILPHDWDIGTPLDQYMGQLDYVFDIEVTMNRPDCLSHIGIAREISAVTRLKLKIPSNEVNESDEPASDYLSVEIDAPNKCPRYAARLIKGIKIAPSPMWMQQRLEMVGVRPISNVVDVTNYVMLEVGHPLHAFDSNLVQDGRIIVRTADEDEKFVTLDSKEPQLVKSDLLIADENRGIALAGVMGGLNTEIQDDTTDVLLECAYFEPTGIRVTSRDRAISSESSRRFERGADPELVPFAIERAARLIKQLAGGQICQGIVDNYPKPWRQKKINLRPTRVNKLLGIRIQSYKMKNYLTGLGCKVEVVDAKNCTVNPPSWRHDLTREVDLIEEIARIHGYDRIGNAVTSRVPLSVNVNNENQRKKINQIKSSLTELGLREAINYSLIPASEFDKFPVRVEPAKVLNPLSEDMALLRPSLAVSLLSAAERNIRAGVDDVRLFEWGKCFWSVNGKISEEYRLGGVICGQSRPDSWLEKSRNTKIHDIKGVIEQFAHLNKLDNIRFICYDVIEYLKYGGKILTKQKNGDIEIGWFGQIHPDIAERFNLSIPVYMFEFIGSRLLELTGKIPIHRPLPRYPAATRDLAFVLNSRTDAQTLDEIIWKFGGKNLTDVNLFDLYSGEGIDKDQKSLAYHLTFRDNVRTLSDSEVDQFIDRIVKEIENKVGASLRSIK